MYRLTTNGTEDALVADTLRELLREVKQTDMRKFNKGDLTLQKRKVHWVTIAEQ